MLHAHDSRGETYDPISHRIRWPPSINIFRNIKPSASETYVDVSEHMYIARVFRTFNAESQAGSRSLVWATRGNGAHCAWRGRASVYPPRYHANVYTPGRSIFTRPNEFRT